MTTEELEQIKKIIREETVSKEEYQNGQAEIRTEVKTSIQAEVKASEERIKTELKQAIDKSQEDTIEALSKVIHTGYNMHEERIKRLEDQTEQPHKN